MIQHQSAIVILAAGSSSRMGKPKQLLKYKEETLIRRVCKLAIATGCEKIFPVLGANKDQIAKEIDDLKVDIIDNPNWEAGMSTSLKAAVQHIEATNLALEGILILLVDQPYVKFDFIEQLLATAKTNPTKIIATTYKNILGVPAYFPNTYFAALQAIKGDKGARKVLVQYQEQAIKLPFPEAAHDIDTPKEWENFLKNSIDN